jgi:hypothetical protein
MIHAAIMSEMGYDHSEIAQCLNLLGLTYEGKKLDTYHALKAVRDGKLEMHPSHRIIVYPGP